MDRALWQQKPGQFFDQDRVDNRWRDGRMAKHMLLHAGRVYDITVEIDQSFAIGKIKWRVSVDLPPNEHVLCRQTDLFVPVTDVGANRIHYLVLWKIDLRIQIGNTEFASPAAAGRHLDHAEGRAGVREQDRVAFLRMLYVDLLWQFFAGDR